MISVRFQGNPFNITEVIQVYAPTSNAEEAEVERFYVFGVTEGRREWIFEEIIINIFLSRFGRELYSRSQKLS